MKECATHHHACDCREEKMRELAEAAYFLAHTYWQLDRYGYIGTADDPERRRAQEYRDMGLRYMKQVRAAHEALYGPQIEP